MRSTRRIAVAAAGAAATLAAATAVAIAATPKPGLWSGAGEGGGVFTVAHGHVGPAGTKPNRRIVAPSSFKCNSSNLVVKAARIPISGGRFRYDGKAYVDRFRAPSHLGHLVWTGRFTSATRVKGTYRFTSPVTPKISASGVKFVKKPCDSGKHVWVGTPGTAEGEG
jgi:hypothetical protein